MSLENATLFSLEEKRNSKVGIFCNPTVEEKIIEYYEVQHSCLAGDNLF